GSAWGDMSSQDAERRELERVVELLGRNTRPGRLLAYVGAKYFEPQAEQLTEFTIATEVFGRSAKDFDPTQDAVVRVDTHRLRKKLREHYEKDGDTHDLQICLPAGSYVPKFVAAPEQEAAKSPPVRLTRTPHRAPRLGGRRFISRLSPAQSVRSRSRSCCSTASGARKVRRQQRRPRSWKRQRSRKRVRSSAKFTSWPATAAARLS